MEQTTAIVAVVIVSLALLMWYLFWNNTKSDDDSDTAPTDGGDSDTAPTDGGDSDTAPTGDSDTAPSAPSAAHALQFDTTDGGDVKYHLDIPLGGDVDPNALGKTGKYVIRFWVYVSTDYSSSTGAIGRVNFFDGASSLLKTQWITMPGLQGSRASGFQWADVSERWTEVVVTTDIAAPPQLAQWYVGEPGRSERGRVWITELQLVDPDGAELLEDGHFPNGKDMSTHTGYGTKDYSPEELRDLIHIVPVRQVG